jgi:hypothetical protein
MIPPKDVFALYNIVNIVSHLQLTHKLDNTYDISKPKSYLSLVIECESTIVDMNLFIHLLIQNTQ